LLHRRRRRDDDGRTRRHDGDVEANGCEGRTADDAFQDKNNLFRNPPEPGIRPESGEKDL
jgi:hypothetical protein